MGYSPANPVERGKWNKGLASLRACNATPDLIADYCARYRSRFGSGIPLNPMSLASNWTTLGMALPAFPTEVTRHASNQVRQSAAPARLSVSGGGRSNPARSGGHGQGQSGYHAAIVAEARSFGLTPNELMGQRGEQYERDLDAYRRKWWPQDFADSDEAAAK
jgi:hypothetical protein